jgi:heme/copper-type cytochrome/quinol oxidase subunit 2
MYLIGAILVIVITAVVYGIRRARKARNNKRTQNDYNGFHLGEMTKHDVPAKFLHRKEQSKYTSHYHGDDKRKESTKNEKGKK